MSLRASTWAIDVQCPSPACKLVLLLLADCHNNHSQDCFPKLATLAHQSGLSESGVKTALRWLEQAGILRREQRKAENGRTLGVQYWFDFENGRGHSVTPGDVGRGQRLPPQGVNGCTHEGSTVVPSIEEQEKETGKRTGNSLSDRYASDFERLWLSFPRNPNSSKARAYKLWKKLNQDDREDCQDAGDLYRAELDKQPVGKDGRKAVMHLSTFISHQMWENYINGQHQTEPGLFGSNGAGHHHG
jgi:hypothetical protein